MRIYVRRKGEADTLLEGHEVRIRLGDSLLAKIEGSQGLQISSELPSDWRTAFYRDNLRAIVNREDITTQTGAAFNFEDNSASPDGYYISRLQGQWALHNQISITGGPTFRWEPIWDPTAGEDSTGAYVGMYIDDIGRPDLDCDDYLILAKYVDRLAAAYDAIKDQILGNPVGEDAVAGDPSDNPVEHRYAITYGLYRQYQTTLALWNYLVHVSSVVFNVSLQHGALFIQGRYTNRLSSNSPLKQVTISCALVKGPSANAEQITGTLFNKIPVTTSVPGGTLPVFTFNEGLKEQSFPAGDPPVNTAIWELTPIDPREQEPTPFMLAPRQEISFLSRIDLDWITPFKDPEDESKGRENIQDCALEVTMAWLIQADIIDGTEDPGSEAAITREKVVPLEETGTSITDIVVKGDIVTTTTETITPEVSITYTGGSAGTYSGAFIVTGTQVGNQIKIDVIYRNNSGTSYTVPAFNVSADVLSSTGSPRFGITLASGIGAYSNTDDPLSWAVSSGYSNTQYVDTGSSGEWGVEAAKVNNESYSVGSDAYVMASLTFTKGSPTNVPPGLDSCILQFEVEWVLKYTHAGLTSTEALTQSLEFLHTFS